MKVALHSADPRLGDVEANVRTVAAAADGADLVVFPELFLTGYNIGDDLQRLAFGEDDERLAPLVQAVRSAGTHVIVGAPYTPRPGLTYNAALCVGPDGHVLWVPKRALPNFAMFQEAMFFDHGEVQPVWRTRLGDIGVHICYDLYFPEFQKRHALDGADILVNISASPANSRRFFETLLEARAVENAVFMLYSNNVGSQGGITFWGGSRAYGPRGQLLGAAEPYEATVLTVDLDLEDLQSAREFRPTIRDSRPQDLEAVAEAVAGGSTPED